jgi:NADPH-dependent 2,4-dienoyl-CoA reductase/sulfur reductase-like enzyme
MAERLVIIGGVAAGVSAAARARRTNPALEIVVYEKSGYVSYGSCGFPYFIKGEIPHLEDLIARTPEQFAQQDIQVHVRHEVMAIDPRTQSVRVHNRQSDQTFSDHWDKLILTAGAVANCPPLPGLDLRGVFSLRTVEDALAIRRWLAENQPKRGVIIGGGYIGLEMAEALAAHGLHLTLIEALPQVMPTLDADMAIHVEAELKSHHVDVLLGQPVSALEGDQTVREVVARVLNKLPHRLSTLHPPLSLETISQNARVRVVHTGSTAVETDLVIFGAGAKPNIPLAKNAGIALGSTGAVAVNDRQQTNIPRIWAAGDVAEAYHRVTHSPAYVPLGTTANKQGRVAGTNAAGGDARFGGIVGTAVVKIFDLEVAHTGLAEQEAARLGFKTTSVTISAASRADYMPGHQPVHLKLVYEKETQRLLGAQMIGREGIAKRIDVLAAALHVGLTTFDLADLDLSYAPPFSPVWDPILVAANVANK